MDKNLRCIAKNIVLLAVTLFSFGCKKDNNTGPQRTFQQKLLGGGTQATWQAESLKLNPPTTNTVLTRTDAAAFTNVDVKQVTFKADDTLSIINGQGKTFSGTYTATESTGAGDATILFKSLAIANQGVTTMFVVSLTDTKLVLQQSTPINHPQWYVIPDQSDPNHYSLYQTIQVVYHLQ
ncbi:MAG: hypothetical protein JWM92_569 [Candidatus Nomurabacteria bacterium]|nr:hypothetical protein [Candidatus Nomurabacteria bacterium]